MNLSKYQYAQVKARGGGVGAVFLVGWIQEVSIHTHTNQKNKQEILVQYLSVVFHPLSISAYPSHGYGGLEPIPADIRREAGYALSSRSSVVYLFVFSFCRSTPVAQEPSFRSN